MNVAHVTDDKSISLKATEKRFGSAKNGVQALTPTTIDIAGGGMTILLGPSGCGKTTMLRLIAGLVAPTSGIIEIGGVNLWANGRRNSVCRAGCVLVAEADVVEDVE